MSPGDGTYIPISGNIRLHTDTISTGNHKYTLTSFIIVAVTYVCTLLFLLRKATYILSFRDRSLIKGSGELHNGRGAGFTPTKMGRWWKMF